MPSFRPFLRAALPLLVGGTLAPSSVLSPVLGIILAPGCGAFDAGDDDDADDQDDGDRAPPRATLQIVELRVPSQDILNGFARFTVAEEPIDVAPVGGCGVLREVAGCEVLDYPGFGCETACEGDELCVDGPEEGCAGRCVDPADFSGGARFDAGAITLEGVGDVVTMASPAYLVVSFNEPAFGGPLTLTAAGTDADRGFDAFTLTAEQPPAIAASPPLDTLTPASFESDLTLAWTPASAELGVDMVEARLVTLGPRVVIITCAADDAAGAITVPALAMADIDDAMFGVAVELARVRTVTAPVPLVGVAGSGEGRVVATRLETERVDF